MVFRAWPGNRFSLVTLALLSLVTVAAWASVVIQATGMASGDSMGAEMSPGAGMSAVAEPRLTIADATAYVASWVVMMAAMMLPSAAPMILLYRMAARGRAARGNPQLLTWIFVLGYLMVWAAFGGVVYLAGALVATSIVRDARLAAWMPYGVALVLLVAGAYQLTPLKLRCLRACQSPLGFLMGHWKPGVGGAFRMGLEHGWNCAACCWGLMVVLVAAGAMGLRWVLVIALMVAAEKLLPQGRLAARMSGVLLLGLGALIVAQPHFALALHR